MTGASDHTLNRTKIQRLLAAVGTNTAARPSQSELDAVAYDWRDPHYFTPDQRNRLAAVMAQVAALLSEKFVHFCGAKSNVTPLAITEQFAGGLSSQIELSHSFCLAFGPDPKQPCGFFAVDSGTAMGWVKLLLGDTETDDTPDRALSALEESLLGDVVLAVTESFLEALRPAVSLTHTNNITRNDPCMPYEATDEICVIAFELKRSDADEASQMRFVLPSPTLAALVGKPIEAPAALPREERQRVMMDHLQQMPVTITAKLSSTRLSFEEVLDLAQDDIILLDTRANETIELIMDGRTVFHGRPVQSDGQYAILMTQCDASTAPTVHKPAAVK